MYIDPNTGGMFFQVIACLLGIAIVAIIFSALKKSGEKNEIVHNNVYNKILQKIPQDKQVLFSMQYNAVKKDPNTAALLCLFLGGVGGHKFYMGETGLGILYLLFCWTYIPGIVAFIELFTISGQITKYNEKQATEIASMLSGASINAPIASRTTQTNLCIECGKYYEGQHRFCPNCGKEINPRKFDIPTTTTISSVNSHTNISTPQYNPEPIQSPNKVCPKCAVFMEIKEHEGKKFYVCPNYKTCQQVSQI